MPEMLENEANDSGSDPLGQSLSQTFYSDETLYGRELAWLRENMWFVVGHESQIALPGEYFLYEFDRESVIVVRDHAGRINAHYNVCRHHGSRICTQTGGLLRTLTCPYHAWSYDLDGTLRTAPFAPEDFDKTQYSLAPCHVRVHCGLICLSFAQVAPDFDSYIGFITRELQLQDLQRAKIAKRSMFSVDANWKLVVENNLECYHCGPAHRTYCTAHPGIPLGRPEEYVTQARSDRVRRVRAGAGTEESRQFRPAMVGHSSRNFHYLVRQVIGKDVETESVDGRRVAPLMGRSTYDGVQTMGLASPLNSIVLNPDHAVVYNFTPRSVRKTDIEAFWLVKGTATAGIDYDESKVSAVFEPTLKEDKILVENAQLGIESSAYRPGPYIESESFVSEFDRWYLRHIVNKGV
jgi:Rieske 2Fe-2S family protein